MPAKVVNLRLVVTEATSAAVVAAELAYDADGVMGAAILLDTGFGHLIADPATALTWHGPVPRSDRDLEDAAAIVAALLDPDRVAAVQ